MAAKSVWNGLLRGADVRFKNSLNIYKSLLLWKLSNEKRALRYLHTNSSDRVHKRKMMRDAQVSFQENLQKSLCIQFLRCHSKKLEDSLSSSRYSLSPKAAEALAAAVKRWRSARILMNLLKVEEDRVHIISSANTTSVMMLAAADKIPLSKAKPRNNLASICNDVYLDLCPRGGMVARDNR